MSYLASLLSGMIGSMTRLASAIDVLFDASLVDDN